MATTATANEKSAIQNANLAEKNLHRVHETVEQFYKRVFDDGAMYSEFSPRFRRETMEQLLVYYSQVAESNELSGFTRESLVGATSGARVANLLGEMNLAESFVEKGNVLLAKLCTQENPSNELKHLHANLVTTAGNVAQAKLDYKLAIDCYKKACELLESIDGDYAQHTNVSVVTMGNLAVAERLAGNKQAAVTTFWKLTNRLIILIQQEPDNELWWSNLGKTYGNMSELLNVDDAHKMIDRALGLWKDYINKFPNKKASACLRLGADYRRKGAFHLHSNELDAARKMLEKSEDFLRDSLLLNSSLVAWHHENGATQAALVGIYRKLGLQTNALEAAKTSCHSLSVFLDHRPDNQSVSSLLEQMSKTLAELESTSEQ